MSKYIIYCRKSSESEDRQILSVESQTRELLRLAETRGLHVVEVVTEAKSAKKPGRPAFTSVMGRIQSGEVGGIICWKLDRLARNALDGGSLIHAMSAAGLEIVTPTQTYRKEDDNLLLMYLEFGVAQKYVDDLSKNVKRGLRTKAENGWYPATPPPGYRATQSLSGEKIIEKDPGLYEPVKDLWHSILYSSMSVTAARIHIAHTWRLTPSRKCPLKNKEFSKSTIYRILNNPFYMGRFEYPTGSGQFFAGRHEPMVSKDEFLAVQEKLNQAGKGKKTKRREFPFRGLISCGECDAKITYEEKRQIICERCRCKFSEPGKTECPSCGGSIKRMRSPKRLFYNYCHCTKQKNPRCSQRSISITELESQMSMKLREIGFSNDFMDWLEKNVESIDSENVSTIELQRKSLERGLTRTTTALEKLVALFTSAENSNQSLLRLQEYSVQRKALTDEERRVTIALKALPLRRKDRFASLKTAARFAAKAAEAFENGTPDAKHEIIDGIYSNLTLTNKKLSFRARFTFQALEKYNKMYRSKKPTFEPKIEG